MARCKNCNNLYNLSDENDKIVGKWCPKINESPDIECDRECEHFKNMTNADKIRAMNDEELAEFLDGTVQSTAENLFSCDKRECDECQKCYLQWLQSEAE